MITAALCVAVFINFSVLFRLYVFGPDTGLIAQHVLAAAGS
jgi:hypothetical protein